MNQLRRIVSTTLTAACFLGTGWLGSLNHASAQDGMRGGEWRTIAGGKGSTKYSDLDEINPDNVHRLKQVWTWDSPENARAEDDPLLRPLAFEGTPIYADGMLYTSTTHSEAVAINPATGEQVWVFDSGSWKDGRPTAAGWVHRGVSFWSDGDDKRIFIATGNARLWAIDPADGKPIPTFGDGGMIDLRATLRRPATHRQYGVNSPPIICGDTVVVGAAISDRPLTKEMPPGDVRGFDARTGKLKWTFHNPPLEGEYGYDTWEDGSAEYTGNANVWAPMSADEELGYVYLPFGTPTSDFYGGYRPGKGLFGESLVCLDAETGERIWHFQHVHHGLWDFDLPAAPVLGDVVIDGAQRKIVAQVTKQGYCWVLDRVTGEPIWPIEERPVPQSTAPGETSWPTQPHPTKPKPFEQQGSWEDDLIDFTPELRADALEILKQYNHGDLYEPPIVGKVTITRPGHNGGANWTGASFDPDSGWLYVPTRYSLSTVELVEPDPARSNMRLIGKVGGWVDGPSGLHLFKPPYGKVVAIDLNTGDEAWWTPLGDGPIAHPLLKDMNLEPMGDARRGYPLLTKTMLFIGQSPTSLGGHLPTDDPEGPNLYVFDKRNGDEVWRGRVPGNIFGNPMTYRHEGTQYIAIPLTGPSRIVALALDTTL